MVMVYYVDCRFYLLQAMYAYGLKGFLITLSQTEKRILSDGGTSHGSQSMTRMFAGKQPQHSDSHSQLKGDNCNV